MKRIRNERCRNAVLARRTIVAAVAALFADAALGQALPTGGTVATGNGNAAISQSGAAMTVNQTTQRAIIDWTSFNIGNGASVTFVQPGTTSVAVNRVGLAGGASAIDGALSANGNVMILNPNGVMFGSNAVVNVAGLIASTGNIDATQFMLSPTASFAITGATGSSVSNAGRITVSTAGLAAFVAPSVSNSGTITATGGRITLASAQAATISLNGGLYEIAVDQGVAAGTIANTNTGTLTTGTSAGTIVLSALDAANLVSGAINLEGVQQASRIEVDGGHVVLKSDLNAATVAGSSTTVDVYSGAHVQDAIDIAAAGATVNVRPGNYTEIAAGRDIGIPGIYDLGLLVNKDGLTLRGVDASGNPIASAAGVQAWISAGAATDFGMNHGVVADNVTVQGLGFKPYVPGANKTIEIAGDNLTFRNSVVDNTQVPGGAGALYFGELLAGHQIGKLSVTGSIFLDGSVSLQNGVGVAADGTYQPAADRVVSGNTFTGGSNYTFGGLLLTGKMDEVPWRPMPIGAATVTGNSFSGFDESVLVRGEQQGVDLKQIMHDNSFDRAVLVTDAGGHARAGQYTSLNNVVRDKFSIQSGIQAGVDRAANGDTVTVGAGHYAEQITVAKSITLVGAGQDSTIITPTSLAADADGMRYILTIGGGPATNVEVSRLQLKGPVPAITAGIFVRDGAHANIHDDKLIDMRESAVLSGNQRGLGILVGRALVNTSGTAEIRNNVVTGYQKGGIVVDGPGSAATVTGNTVTGEGSTNVIAQNGIQISRGASATVSGNTVSGNRYAGVQGSADDEATGILIFNSGPYLAQGSISVGPNTSITGNDVGIWTNDPRTLTTIDLTGASGNTRNAEASFGGGYAGQGPLLEYPAWSAAGAAYVSPTAFSGTQAGDIVNAGGALRVSGWSGFAAIQPAIGAVAAGGTVEIGAGTYAENVTLGVLRKLMFDGATLHSLTINPGAAGSGIGGSVTADGAGGLVFNAPVVLLRDTTLATTGANIAFNAAIQNAGAVSNALTLTAGTGDITLASGGTQGGPLGALRTGSHDFTLNNDMWVTGFALAASGRVLLIGQLHGTDVASANTINGVRQAVELPEALASQPQLLVPPPIQISPPVAFVNPPAPGSAPAQGGRAAPLVTPSTGTGSAPARSTPTRAGDALDRGRSVEIDLTPGN